MAGGGGRGRINFPGASAEHLWLCVSRCCCFIKCLFTHLSSCFSGERREGRSTSTPLHSAQCAAGPPQAPAERRTDGDRILLMSLKLGSWKSRWLPPFPHQPLPSIQDAFEMQFVHMLFRELAPTSPNWPPYTCKLVSSNPLSTLQTRYVFGMQIRQHPGPTTPLVKHENQTRCGV